MKPVIFGSGMRVFFYGRLRWKNVDHFFPSLSGVDVVSDEHPHDVTHRWYQLAWFGYTVNLNVSTTKRRKGFVLSMRDLVGAICRVLV